MTKNQKSNVTSMVSTEESKEYKKRRMKEIRTIVARAVENNTRIDQLGFDGNDIPRVIIALQDLLMKTQERHKKASNHVAAAAQMSEYFALIMDAANEDIINMTNRVGELSSALYNERMDHSHTKMQLQNMSDLKRIVEDDLLALKRSFELLNG